MSSDDFDEADLAELAKLEGKTVEEVKKELLRERLLRGKKTRARDDEDEVPRERAIARTRPEVQVTHTSRGNIVEREDDESAEEAMERWLEQESRLPDGLFGLGGQTAGGIFGGGPIATSIHDPEAHARGDARLGQLAGVRMLGLVAELEQRFAGLLPPAPNPRALPRRR